jgi:uncharacterized protein (TIGR03435 family)
MTIPDLWRSAWAAPLFNHLWQSTLVIAIAWLLALAFRQNAARVRYAIWMLASFKFLLPFALISYLGAHWARPIPGKMVGSAVYTAADEIAQPFQASFPSANHAPAHSADWLLFLPTVLAAIWLSGFLAVLLTWMVRWRRMARVAHSAVPIETGRELDALRRAEVNAGVLKPIALRASSFAIEPGVFGIRRPVLLWPEGISAQLDDAQIASIVAHEVEHVRRRDNLTAALHMLVEALFWFHPAVHWMGSRLLDERERACDERVLELSAQPESYAESILKVCAFCLEPPAPCVAGVSGSDLKQRILRIMTHRAGIGLSVTRKIALAVVALLAIALPVGFGMLHAMQAPAEGKPDSAEQHDVSPDVPRFDVSTVKPAASSEMMSRFMLTPDGISLQGVPIQMLLREAFQFQDDRIVGAPGWVKTNRYDVEAKVSPEDAPKLEKLKIDERRSMFLPLLVDRFHLKYHHETRDLPSYSLMIAKGGPKLKESSQQTPPAKDGESKNSAPRGRMMMDRGRLQAEGTTLQFLAQALSRQLGRTVVDKTGLAGNYDYILQWTPDDAPPPGPGPGGGPPNTDAGADPVGPSIFTALQEQLGLKLESAKGPVDVIVIDHMDLPTEN